MANNAHLQTQLAVKHDALTAAHNEVAALRPEVTELRTQVTALRTQCSTLRNQYEEEKDKRQRLERAVVFSASAPTTPTGTSSTPPENNWQSTPPDNNWQSMTLGEVLEDIDPDELANIMWGP